jgi:gamma-glutamylcyclotransferase (GGCT)/AIG2-like uncharacterized protein YtfP
MNTDLLFVYGSLLNSSNDFGRYLIDNAAYLQSAVFKGRLYDCGEYPGAVADTNGYNIKGTIYQLQSQEEGLAVLDDYEGYGDDQEQPNLFIRKRITVISDDQFIECWVYLYNLPVDGLKEIQSGDYLAYLP